jgi:hypothetical protein
MRSSAGSHDSVGYCPILLKNLFVDTLQQAEPVWFPSPPKPDFVNLDELECFQTRMPVLADDDVVVHGNAERGGDLDDRLGHMDIGLRWRWVAGVVVHQQTQIEIS